VDSWTRFDLVFFAGSVCLYFDWKDQIVSLVELNNFSKKRLLGFLLEEGFLRVNLVVSLCIIVLL